MCMCVREVTPSAALPPGGPPIAPALAVLCVARCPPAPPVFPSPPPSARARRQRSGERVARVYTIRWFGAGDARVAAPPSKLQTTREHVSSFIFLLTRILYVGDSDTNWK